jgi:hypothetical protein
VYQKIPGFEPIPFGQIGLHLDEYRHRLPTDAEVGRRSSATPGAKSGDKNFGT